MKKRETKPVTKEKAAPVHTLLKWWGGLESLYHRLPKLPFIDKDTSAILIISLLLYALFVAAAYFSGPQEELHAIIMEGPLAKNSQLALLPGENYVYEISAGGSQARLSYEVRSSSECPGTLVVESSEEGLQNSACINRQGNLEGDPFQLNSSLGNKSLLLFSPWMLAVSEDFSWQVQNTISTGSANIDMPLNFRSFGAKEVAGRRAYEISVRSDFTPQLKYLVDSEKRILILAEFTNASARLVQAPFPLNWTK